ncbi:MAG: cobaltochelatase subunit CobN [Acidimicrobiales bacterium]
MILFLTNADTEILALRVVAESLPDGFPALAAANPAALEGTPGLDGVDVVLVRLLGGRQAWREPFDQLQEACRQRRIPLLAFGGEAVPDGELAACSTVPAAIVTQAFAYLSAGGVANLVEMLKFVADTVLLEGFGFQAPVVVPDHGVLARPGRGAAGDVVTAGDAPGGRDASRLAVRPRVAVLFYRAHVLAGNTGFVHDLCDALEAAGADPLPIFAYSLRAGRGTPSPGEGGPPPGGPSAGPTVMDLLSEASVDAVVVTMLAAGGLDDTTDSWDAGPLGTLGVPILQAICATRSADEWRASTSGLTPVDAAMTVAIPEFDGRIVTVPFSFKEVVDDGLAAGTPVTAYRTQADRVARVAELATALARLRGVVPAERRIAIVLSAYPTKRSRLGNAVGLDTPASVIGLLHALRGAGYRVDRIPRDGDALMAELADTLTYDRAALTAAQSAAAMGRWPVADYQEWFAGLPGDARERLEQAWGPAPGDVYVEEPGERGTAGGRSGPGTTGGARPAARSLVFSGIDLGGVLVAIQPPRGFGENPIATYHSPDLPPTHHYLAFYRWLATGWGAHAVVHLGKHGTLEWLPGKSVGLSASCFPDAALGSLPLVYPFVVNDPGEGTQAKRRAHAVIVDHLVPPLTRAELTDDLSTLEALLDTHAQVAALDPEKLPEIRRQVWDVLVEAEIHRDLGVVAGEDGESGAGPGRMHGTPARVRPSFEDAAFDDLLVEVDGYLCELKDAQIRGGLHVLGVAPTGSHLVDMVLAVTRTHQTRTGSLRAEVADRLGVGGGTLPDGRSAEIDPRSLDTIEGECRRMVEACAEAGWRLAAVRDDADPGGAIRSSAVLAWVCDVLVPALQATPREIAAVLGALDGRFVEPGPSGAPSRGMAHVLPTGRNFYSVDPKAVPSPLAWKVGQALADRLVERHVAEEGAVPRHVALVVWGTAAMRTAGDDVAEILALLGVRPRWGPSGRVDGIELVPLEELGRPRVDVTVRISGFFRDAFPHVLGLLDDAIHLVASAREPAGDNPIAAAGTADPRVFGPKPGAYGSGILSVIESGNWRTDEDLAQVYLAWSGYSYQRARPSAARTAGSGRPGGPSPAIEGVPAGDALRRRLVSVQVAVKNQDNREHDIFDSDDYLQDHGGMVAAIRSLAGQRPKAWFGDSADPDRPRLRSLAEEAARVVRSRVVNPAWLEAMTRHGYKGAFEMAATVDYLFGYDATAGVVEDWMYERVTEAYVADPAMRKFFERSNPWALRAIAERLLEAEERGMWRASDQARQALRDALLEAEGWEEDR